MKSCLPRDAGSADSPDRDPALLAPALLHQLLCASDDPAPFWLDNDSCALLFITPSYTLTEILHSAKIPLKKKEILHWNYF
jgi:hypothetical protein